LDSAPRSPNGFLSSLVADDYELIRPHLRTTELAQELVLVEVGETLRRAYLPHRGVISLIVIPWGLALALVSNLFGTYGALSMRQLAVPILFGAGWGIAQVLFGISVTRLGLGLAYAIIVGLGALLGTLVPLFVQQHELTGVRADGVAVRLSACIVCAVEGGLITRLDEYFDSAQVAKFIGAAAA